MTLWSRIRRIALSIRAGAIAPPAGLVIDAALILGEEVARCEVCDPYPT